MDKFIKQVYLFLLRLTNSAAGSINLKLPGSSLVSGEMKNTKDLIIAKRNKKEESEFVEMFNMNPIKAIESFMTVRSPGVEK